MSHYRDLNKELVEQVQTMRKNMKLYCDEIIHLKAELMEKHESEVNLRKQCHNWAVNNFLQLLQYVQPDSEILPLLKEHLPPSSRSRESVSLRVSGGRETLSSRISGGRDKDGHRRSSILTTELKRSNSVINIRKSVFNTSPVRRSINQDSNEEVDNEQHSLYENSEMEEDVQPAENELTHSETLTPVVQNTVENIIYEEVEEEEKAEESESVEEVSIDIHKERSTLKDVTSSLSPLEEKSHLKHVRKRERTKKAKPIINDDDESKIDEHANKSVPLSRDISRLYNETFKSPTSFLIDAAACSTPNSMRVSNAPTTEMGSQTLTESKNISTRPSRKCKPTDLAEPTMRTKLRNDGETKTKSKGRSRSKTKKKS